MKRSKFSLSHYNLMSMNMGTLTPIGLTEVLPGDTVQQATSALVRLSPLLAPVMHPVHVRVHHWFVPHRLVWDGFEDFITGGPDGDFDEPFPTLTINNSNGGVGSLSDYLGLPTELQGDIEVSALPFRAYAMIWNEWYRDQDLQDLLPFSTDSGLDTETSTDLKNVAWEKDYFTSARPWEQKGPAVELGMSGNAPITIKPTGASVPIYSNGVRFTPPGGPTKIAPLGLGAQKGDNTSDLQAANTNLSGRVSASIQSLIDTDALSNMAQRMEADLSSVNALNVSQLREAFALQRYQEARARYGSRYTEYLRYLGVRSSDARLQRPEYLGGGRQTIQFSEVLQTAPGGEDGVGSLYGHGIGALRSNRYRRFFEEHGYIISVMSVRPRTIYTQGMPRTWMKRTKEDFFQKELQHIGQQEVWTGEVYGVDPASHYKTFGYQDRYDEYRRTQSRVTGEFRTSMLDYWHMARRFANEPLLNADFVECNPTKRIFAEQVKDSLYVMVNHSIQARRLVSSSTASYIY